ncbi:MAG TPA: aldo/keto reductase, partial [Candidatus Limnocylindria bacterium]|nr:aldo/keto reductase [Candidatus Limnocylindria bacterium]
SRRELLRAALGAAAVALTGGIAMAENAIRKPIPRTGELLPAVGLGTWQTFDVRGPASALEPLKQVLRDFVRLGGSVVDSSPMYGKSESVVGDLAAELGVQKQLFLATKVWTSGSDAGIRQMEESFKQLRVKRMDLMQVHNLVDHRTHLTTLRAWKEQGKVRYIGVTHYTAGAYDQLARVLAAEDLDFVQFNYSLAEREAEKRLLPLAAERRLAVLINRPFAAGSLFRHVRGKPLPVWSKEIGCATWAQFFLKFVISHPAVTCAIPATAKTAHLTDNMRAASGVMPDIKRRDQMARYFAEI